MNKKLSMAAIILAISSATPAQSFIEQNLLGAKLYLGGNIGGIAFLYNYFLDNNSSPFMGQYQFGSFGLVGGGLGGLVFELPNQFHLSLEGFIDGTNVPISLHAPFAGDFITDDRYNGGGRVLLGYHFFPGYEGHFIAGYVNGNFNYKDTYFDVNQNFSLNGYQLGFGSSVNIWGNLSLRQDVIYNGYQNYEMPYTGIQFKLSSWAGTLGAVYKFDAPQNSSYSK